MQTTKCTLTVYFEDPFWVGVYERVTDDTLEVCKITFGAEPKDTDVYGFLLENWALLRFSPPVPYTRRACATLNPKAYAARHPAADAQGRASAPNRSRRSSFKKRKLKPHARKEPARSGTLNAGSSLRKSSKSARKSIKGIRAFRPCVTSFYISYFT